MRIETKQRALERKPVKHRLNKHVRLRQSERSVK